MKKFIYITFITLFSFQIQAQDKKEALKELFEVMQIEKMTSQMMDNMIPMLQQQAQSSLKKEEDKAKFEEYMKYVMDETKTLCLNLIKNDMPLIYEKHFSYEDIINLTNFYKTPTGQRLLEKTPDVGKETMQIMMTKHIPEFQQKIQAKLKELKKQ